MPSHSEHQLLAPLAVILPCALLCMLVLAGCSSSASSSTSATGTTGPTATATLSPTATTIPPTATVVPPTATPGPFSGAPSFSDSLTDSNANLWDTVSDPGQASCQLNNTGYHLVIYPSYGVTCFMRATTFGNFAFQVDLKFMQGSTTDHGGIVFRSNGDQNNISGYDLYMRADGHYILAACQADNCGTVLLSGTAGAFHGGLNVTNTLGVVARGGKLSVYVNGQFVDDTNDTGFVSGYLGLANTPNNGNTQSEVVYTNAKGWTF
jgi:hypothetical protein